MNDRELLERAARAVGYLITMHRESGFYVRRSRVHEWEKWNPLDEDGDAFRLMVLIGHDECVDYIRGALEACDIEPVGCRLAATRRAITRAAAALADNA